MELWEEMRESQKPAPAKKKRFRGALKSKIKDSWQARQSRLARERAIYRESYEKAKASALKRKAAQDARRKVMQPSGFASLFQAPKQPAQRSVRKVRKRRTKRKAAGQYRGNEYILVRNPNAPRRRRKKQPAKPVSIFKW